MGKETIEKSITQTDWNKFLMVLLSGLVTLLITVVIYVYLQDQKNKQEFERILMHSVAANTNSIMANGIYLDVICDILNEKYGVNITEQVWQRMYIEIMKKEGNTLRGGEVSYVEETFNLY